MSWDIYLERDGVPVQVHRHEEGGTRQMGGSTDARLNVTFNYGDVTRLVKWSFRDLDGKKASATIVKLRRVVDTLHDRPYRDYWAPTPGNAGHAAAILLRWAEQHPDAKWRVES